MAVIVSALSFGQGMKFETASFQDLLTRAKDENKIIFMDAYASWCAPCKLMEKNVFIQQEVGDFYNAHFINSRFDMEKGEGKDIAAKYGVRAYPTYLFINGDGEIVYQGTGYYESPDFIKIGEEAADPSKQIAVLKKKFEAGTQDPDFLKNIIKVFMYSDRPIAEQAAVRYFEGKKGQPLNQEDLQYLFGMLEDSNSPLFKIVESRKDDIIKMLPEEMYNNILKSLKLNAVMKSAYNKESKKLDEELFLRESEKLVSKEEAQKLLKSAKMRIALQNKDIANYQKMALEYYGEGTDPTFSANELNTVAWNFFENIDDTKALRKAVRWAEEGVKKQNEYAINDTVANLYMKLGDKKNAKQWAEKAIELAKASGEDYESTQKVLEQL